MPRVTRIDRADAFKAIETVIGRGEAPTHINVRAELGQLVRLLWREPARARRGNHRSKAGGQRCIAGCARS